MPDERARSRFRTQRSSERAVALAPHVQKNAGTSTSRRRKVCLDRPASLFLSLITRRALATCSSFGKGRKSMRGQPAMRAPILWLVATFVSTLVIFGRPPSVPVAVNGFSPNQELKLPTLAPSDEFCKTQVCPPVRFIVRGLEPSVRVAQDGAVYVASIRGVPGGVDLHRYYRPVDGAPNADGSYPFKYEGQPDGCGILADGCANLGVAEGGGDVDIAVNYPQSGVP